MTVTDHLQLQEFMHLSREGILRLMHMHIIVVWTSLLRVLGLKLSEERNMIPYQGNSQSYDTTFNPVLTICILGPHQKNHCTAIKKVVVTSKLIDFRKSRKRMNLTTLKKGIEEMNLKTLTRSWIPNMMQTNIWKKQTKLISHHSRKRRMKKSGRNTIKKVLERMNATTKKNWRNWTKIKVSLSNKIRSQIQIY